MGDLHGGRRETGFERLTVSTQRIRATAEKFLVREESGYAVLRMRFIDGEAVRVVGNLADMELGSECGLVGRYEFHPQYGRQFKVDSYRTELATNTLGIERFLASGLFKGVGPQTAKRLVAHFGLQTLEILRERPHEVREVPGISVKRAKQLVGAFQAHQDLGLLATFLRGHDLPMHLAQKLAGAYGSGAAALEIMQTSPYQAVEDVRGIGFKTADEIARAVGIAVDAPERIAAALLHTLSVAEDQGHMYLPLSVWLKRTSDLISIPEDDVAVIALRIAARGSVVYEDDGGEIAVYGVRMHRIETNIAQRLLELARKNSAQSLSETKEYSCADSQTEEVCGNLGDFPTHVLSPQQEHAAAAIWKGSLVVLTGGPGTGKTTTVFQVVLDAEKRGCRVVLAAPTGRAAKRLAESTGRQALTLHRLLEVGQQQNGLFGFGRGRNHRLEGDLFIVDEASMIDAPLFSQFLDAMPEGARLLLVGDPEQLPAVGPGTVLSDVIRSGVAQVFALDLVFRQSECSQIIVAAHDVRCGRTPRISRREKDADYFFITEADPERAARLVVDLAADRLPHYLGIDSKEGVQVLAPMRKGICGIDRLNAQLSERFTEARSKSLHVGPRVFRLGDKVMNIKNDYDRDIYNGDIGLVSFIGEEEMAVRFGFGDDRRELPFARAECGSLVHAFAVSVHKSQGSEYPCVVMPVLREHVVLLYRQLLYTAMTRAKKLLVLVGEPKAFEMAVQRVDDMSRYTGLVRRIAGRFTGKEDA